jgi:GNAT superfamily N-acetyltransferase
MPASEFTIRCATATDIPALLSLIEQSVRGLQQRDYTSAQIDASIGSAFGIDRQLIEDRTYFVATPACTPGTLIACSGWSYRKTLCGSDTLAARDASTLSPNDPTSFAKIRAIFVHPDWARRGLGSLVLAHCEAAGRAAGFVRFEMGSTLTGVPLYTRKGYVETRRSQLDLPLGQTLEIVHMRESM